MENNQDKKEHWESKVVGIHAKDIFELAKLLTEINIENWVVASTPIKIDGGYDCLVYIRCPPTKEDSKFREEIGLNQNDRPTEKQLRFLKEHRFKVEPNLSKNQATKIIKEYFDRMNKKDNSLKRDREYSEEVSDY